MVLGHKGLWGVLGGNTKDHEWDQNWDREWGRESDRRTRILCRTGKRTSSRTVTRTSSSFLVEVLVKTKMGTSPAGLVLMESGNSLGSLKMSMDSSPVEVFEVLFPIPSPALGKMLMDRSLKDRLMVVRIKGIEQGRTDADQDA